MTIKVEVLYSEGCLRTPLTIARIQEVSDKIGVGIDLSTMEIDTFDKIMEWNFIGSPTVRINGVDIDPSSRGKSFQGFT